MTSKERYQAFTRGPNSRVVWVPAFYHEQTGKYVIYWNDILDNFGKVNNIMSGPTVVSRARDSRGYEIKPRCINYHHDIALNVVIGDVFSFEQETFTPTTSISRSATPDIDTGRGSVSSHTRAGNSTLSHLTVDSADSKHAVHSRPTSPHPATSFHSPHDSYPSQRSLRDDSGEDSDHASTPEELPTPSFADTRFMQEMNRLEQLAQEQSSTPKALGSRRHTSSSTPSSGTNAQHWKKKAVGDQTSAETLAVLTGSSQTTTLSSTSGLGPDRSINRPDSSWRASVDEIYKSSTAITSKESSQPIQRPSPTQDNSGTSVELCDTIISTADLPTRTTSITKAENPIATLHTLVQGVHSTRQIVEQMEQRMVKGQQDQALLTKQESESTRTEMTQYHESFLSELTKNITQQHPFTKIMETQEQQNIRFLEMQAEQRERHREMETLQIKTMERLAILQNRATSVLTQTYELHEYPIPRLFVVLPYRNLIGTKRFRLHFLCECGENTRVVDGASSAMSHGIHLTRHEGYDLVQPNEFFRRYGSYILALLQMLKYGVAAAGMVVPPISTLNIAGKLKFTEAEPEAVERDLAPGVDMAIEYLQGLTNAFLDITEDGGSSAPNEASLGSKSASGYRRLDEVDLRNLQSFLKVNDEVKVLGNLYRTTTPEGHVKWVCSDHYRLGHDAGAHARLKETVEVNSGVYDQRKGRVTVSLKSSILARQFYMDLSSTKDVHELELTLDWNTTFEDMRALRSTIRQSTVPHLVLDLCNNTGPTSNFMYRNRRSEPIIQIMASGIVRTLFLRNTVGFLSHAKDLLKTTLHIRHFDLGETVSTTEDFGKLEKLIRASPRLARLSVVVGDMDSSFDRLRHMVAQHKNLSMLQLQLQDGTAASVKFEEGLSSKISSIHLKVTAPKSIRLMKMPMVTSVEFLAKYSSSQSIDLVQSVIKEHKMLKEVRIAHLPDGGSDVLRDMSRVITDYCAVWNAEEPSLDDLEGTVNSPAPPKLEGTFTELESLHKRSVLFGMELLIASIEEAPVSEETPEETTEVSTIDNHNTTSLFSLRRNDGSLAMVRYKREEAGSHAAVLYVGNFEISKVLHCSSVTRLTLVGDRAAVLFDDMVKAPVKGAFTKLKTLEFDCKPENIVGFIQLAQLARAQCPALATLNLWNSNLDNMEEFGLSPSRTLITYDLLLRKIDFGDYFVSREEILSLRQLFRGTPLLSDVAMSVSTAALTDPAFAFATRVGLGEPKAADLEGAVQPQPLSGRPVMQWVMSNMANTANAVPVDFSGYSVYSDETSSGVHFRRLNVRTESEASMILEDDDDDEKLI